MTARAAAEKRRQPGVDDCTAQMVHALAPVDAIVDPRPTSWRSSPSGWRARKLGEEAAFRSTEP